MASQKHDREDRTDATPPVAAKDRGLTRAAPSLVAWIAAACGGRAPEAPAATLGEPTVLCSPTAQLEGHVGSVELVGFAPNGVVTAGPWRGGKYSVRVWDVAARTSTPIADERVLAIAPSGTLAVAGADGASASIAGAVPIATGIDVKHAAFSGDGRRLAFGGHDGLGVIDVAENAVMWTWTPRGTGRSGSPIDFGDGVVVRRPSFASPDVVQALAISRDGARLAFADPDGSIRVRDAATGAPQLDLWPHGLEPSFVALAGDTVIGATASEGITRWRRGELATMYAGSDAAQVAAVSRDDALLATGHRSGVVRLWDLQSGKELASAARHASAITAAAISSDGAMLVTAAADGSLLVWPLR